MNLDKIKKTIANNTKSKIALFIRHAEKSQYGDSHLTQKGIDDTVTLAYKLRRLNTNIRIFTSPESRCEQTAKIINSQLQIPSYQLSFSNVLGKPGLQILDSDLYEELYHKFKCREIFHQWKNGLHYNALRNPNLLKYLANKFFQSTCSEKGITLYISQSGTVASIGYALGLVNYDVTDGEWVDFLKGFMISIPEIN